MKHTDLMLNDLVMYQGKILRVWCISDYDIKIDLFEDGEDTPYAEIWQEELDEVKPIPLTAEILEKNGWMKVEVDGVFYPKQLKGELPWIGYATDEDNWRFRIRDAFEIKYVHELQHALRLCGIDKEIVL